jgi:hypothetical protein
MAKDSINPFSSGGVGSVARRREREGSPQVARPTHRVVWDQGASNT